MARLHPLVPAFTTVLLMAAQVPALLAASGQDVSTTRARWNEPAAPFRIVGDTWYVGTRGLTVLAIRTSDGVVLIDAALPESAPQILANLAQIGIEPRDVRVLLSSHAHYDHVGAMAALKARSGAAVIATRPSAALLERGGLDDLHFGDSVPFPPVSVDQVTGDGETVTFGRHVLTANHTPGHTPGSTTWTWRETEQGRAFDVVYADSLTAPGYQLVGNARYPRIVADFRDSARRIAAMPCDVLLTPHPEAVDLHGRAARRVSADVPLLNAGACAEYASQALEDLDKKVATQSAARAHAREADRPEPGR